MVPNPLVSVIMPVYNTANYLHQTIPSLLNQSLRDIEIICVDDGSTDNSLKILNRYAKNDSRLIVINQPNQGAAPARNTGLKAAKGKFLSVLDSDDVFHPNMLEIAYSIANSRRCDMVFFRSDQLIEKEQKYIATPWTAKASQLPAKDVFTIHDVRFNRFQAIQGWTWDKLFARSFISDNNITFQPQRIYNDMLFTFSAYVLSKRISFIDIPLVHQRKRGGGSLSDGASASWKCLFTALTALQDLLIKQGIYSELEKDFLNYVVRMVIYHSSISKPEDKRDLLIEFRDYWSTYFGLDNKPLVFFDPISNIEELKTSYSELS